VIPVDYYVLLSALLFLIGGIGFLVRRNVLSTLMSIEVMLNAANLALVAFNRSRFAQTLGAPPSHTGQVFVFFIIAAEAAEVAVGLAIVLAMYRLRRTVRSDEADLLKN
jgi:NADH-quinone oxidoreductase subunit K